MDYVTGEKSEGLGAIALIYGLPQLEAINDMIFAWTTNTME
jgi:hypothetical protein